MKKKQIISKIANDVLSLGTLETQADDHLDFHNLSIWSIKSALEAAFEAGKQYAKENRDKSK